MTTYKGLITTQDDGKKLDYSNQYTNGVLFFKNELRETGCYSSPLLELDFVLEVCHLKQLRVMLFPLVLRFPHLLFTLSVMPLHFHEIHHLVLQGLHPHIKDRHLSVYIIQAIIYLNVHQWNHCGIINQTFP